MSIILKIQIIKKNPEFSLQLTMTKMLEEQSWFSKLLQNCAYHARRWSSIKKRGFRLATRKINTSSSELQKQSDIAQTSLLFKYHVWGHINQQPKLSHSSDLLPIFYMPHLRWSRLTLCNHGKRNLPYFHGCITGKSGKTPLIGT